MDALGWSLRFFGLSMVAGKAAESSDTNGTKILAFSGQVCRKLLKNKMKTNWKSFGNVGHLVDSTNRHHSLQIAIEFSPNRHVLWT